LGKRVFTHLNKEIDPNNYWVPQNSDRYAVHYNAALLLHLVGFKEEVQKLSATGPS
jgi:hypothetical protein